MMFFTHSLWITWFYSSSLDGRVESMKHKIPQGGLFDLVSSPNYFAEILIYMSLAGLFQFSNPTWNVVTLWVAINQVRP